MNRRGKHPTSDDVPEGPLGEDYSFKRSDLDAQVKLNCLSPRNRYVIKVLPELNALIVSTSTCLLSAAGDGGSARLLTHLGEYAEKKNQRAPPVAPPEYTEPIEIVPHDDGWLGYDEPVFDF